MDDPPGRECSKKNYHVGVDVGTGSVRALVIDENGACIASAVEDISEWQPKPNIYLQSISEIWTSICHAVRLAVERGKVEPDLVGSIAFAATCSLALFTHDTGEPISAVEGSEESDGRFNIILWKDQRAKAETDAINRTGHEHLAYFGGSISILMELPKILWLKHHMPEAEYKRCKFYDLHDALTFTATRHSTFPCSEACATDILSIGVDGTAKGWDRDFLTAVGLEDLADDDFMRVGGACRHGKAPPAGTFVGTLSPEAALDLGLREDLKVGIGTIDSYSGWIGTVGMKVDGEQCSTPLHSRMAVVSGTSSCYIIASRKPALVPGVWGPYQDWVMPGYWMSEGGQVATGMLLQHIVEGHPAHNLVSIAASGSGISVFDYLDKHLEEMRSASGVLDIAYLARHYFYYGDLYGNRSPISDASMTGSVVGLTADKSIDDLAIQYFGALEFIAFQLRQVISDMNKAGMEITTLFMSGSVVKNAGLMRLIATACNMPVVVPETPSLSVSFGAALLAVKASLEDMTDDGDSLWTIMQRLRQPAAVRQPADRGFLKELLDVKYTIYLELCERQRAFRRMVDQAVGPHTDLSSHGPNKEETTEEAPICSIDGTHSLHSDSTVAS